MADRYQIRDRVSEHSAVTCWRADDLVLARPVTLHALDTHRVDRITVHDFLAAAVATGRLRHAAAEATFDADDLGDVAYVVTEWVAGVSLADLLVDGPLPTGRMRHVLVPVAELLAQAHAAGVQHGDLRPGDVVVTASGQVKLRGLGLPRELPAPEAERADVRALGALVYACLTARWPLGGGELPSAPLDDTGRLCAPWQVKAGVPREADALATAAMGLNGRRSTPLGSAAEVAAALEALPYDDEPSTPPTLAYPASSYPASYPARRAGTSDPRSPSPSLIPRMIVQRVDPAAAAAAPWRHRLLRHPFVTLLAALVVLAVAAAIIVLTTAGGSPSSGTAQGAVGDRPPAAPSTSVLAPAAVEDFDPYGSPPTEQPQLVPLAHDQNPATAWLTETYTTARLGSLKPGVGLRLDLGQVRSVRDVTLRFPFPGLAVQIRAGDTDDVSNVDAYRVVWSSPVAPQQAVARFDTPVRARFWVIWLTGLVPQGGGYQGGVSEVTLHG